MNKTIKIILVTVLIVVLVIALVGLGIITLISYVMGARFSPEAAMEALSMGSSEQKRFPSNDCRFYYQTVEDHYLHNNNEILDDWIIQVTPVIKDGFLWRANPDPRSYVVYAEGIEKGVASFVTVELKGKYHNFIIPFFEGTEPEIVLPEGFPSRCYRVSVDGETIELVSHSYFVTDTEVTEFEIDGVKFTIDR